VQRTPPADTHDRTVARKEKSSPPASASQNEEDDPLLIKLDRTAYPQMQDAHRVLERALILLRIAQDEFHIDGLGSSRIAKVLTDKFRYRTTYQAVQQALDAANDKVDRVSVGRATIYRIMSPGEAYLDNKDFPTKAPRKGGRKSTHSKRSTASAKVVKKPKTESKSKKPAGTRKGATILLKELLQEGYFTSSRRISEIKDHLDHNKGRSIPIVQLSTPLLRLLRNNQLERHKAEDGQYEYKSR
jgi:hypothetical protein